MRIDLRPALVGLVAVSVVTAAYAAVRAAPAVWAVDAHRNLAGADALLRGAYGSVDGYLYSPIAAAITAPALAIPTDVAVVAYLLLRILLLVAGALIAGRTLPRADRALLVISVLAFLPLVYDLELGNVTTLVLAGIVVVTWLPDRAATGIPLGLILATAPKPQLIPFLLWMILVRPRSFLGAAAISVAMTVVGVAVLGIDSYQRWAEILRAPAYLSSGPVINLSVWAWPLPVALAAAAGATVTSVLALRNGYWAGLLAATCLGMLVAPYTLVYAAGVIVVVAPAAARAAPRWTLALSLSAPIGVVVAFPIWVAAALVLAAVVPRDRWPGPPSAMSLGER